MRACLHVTLPRKGWTSSLRLTPPPPSSHTSRARAPPLEVRDPPLSEVGVPLPERLGPTTALLARRGAPIVQPEGQHSLGFSSSFSFFL